MLVDYERVLLDLKAAVASKNSHGQRDLLSLIARLEAQHAIPPDEYERFVRQFGHHLADSFMGLLPRVEDDDPPTDTAASASAVVGTPHLRSQSPRDSEESCQTTQPQTHPPGPQARQHDPRARRASPAAA